VAGRRARPRTADWHRPKRGRCGTQDADREDAGGAPFQIAEVYALRNDAKATFEWLDRAWSSRDAGVGLLLFDPFILRFKDDPRFAAFCRKVGLPVPGNAAAVKAS
jgi:hypothetical protein